jgi:ribose transport system substrate-binding protein
MHKRVSIVLAALFFFAVVGAATNAGEKKLVIGFNNPLKGLYSVDILEKSFVAACNALGVEAFTVNDEGRLENAVANIDNMISTGVDGIVFFGATDTLFPVAAMKCDEAGIPLVCYDHMPSDDILGMINNTGMYKGIAATVDGNTGSNMGEYALTQNLKRAVVITGDITDTTHAARTQGFIDAFTAGGGEIATESYGILDLSSVMTRANDVLIAHPDIDCVYATNGDIGSVVIEALSKHPNVKAQVLVTDLDPPVLTGLESGLVSAANGAHWVNTNFAVALLVNALRGNELREEDGTPPRLVVPVTTLPSKYVGLYEKHWIREHPFSDDEIRAMVAPDMTLDKLRAIIADYNIEARLAAKGVALQK